MASSWLNCRMNAFVPKTPHSTNSRELRMDSTKPVVAASLASRNCFAPSLRDTRAFMPTPVPTATAICSIWAE